MKVIFGLFLSLICSATVFSQIKPCPLTLKDSPSIRNVKLGMPLKDFLNLTKSYNLKFGSKYLAKNFDSPPSELFKGVDNIEVSDYEDKIYQYSIEYKKNVKWDDAEEFAQNLSENLNLPYDSWKFNKILAYEAVLHCAEFSVSINSLAQKVLIVDDVTVANKEKDAKDRELNRKKTFKP